MPKLAARLDLLDRVTVAEAAERLGISQNAVRQRIRRGTIEYQRAEDGRLYVYLTPAEIKSDAVPYGGQDALLKHLQRENDFLRKELERKDHLLAATLERLAAALQRVPPALGVPPSVQQSPVTSLEASASSSSKAEEKQLAEKADEKRDERRRLAESLERSEPSSLQEAEEDSKAQPTPSQTNQTGSGRLTAKAEWTRIGLATFLAGAIPPILANLVLVAAYFIVGYAINRHPLADIYLFFYFLVHLLPLPLGIRAGLAWPGNHPRGYALLGIAVGTIVALINGGIVIVVTDMIVLAVEDYVAVFSTATLFVSGALYADVIEARRKLPTASEGAVSADAAGLNKTTLLLVQAIAPAMLGLVGTIVTALATLLKP